MKHIIPWIIIRAVVYVPLIEIMIFNVESKVQVCSGSCHNLNDKPGREFGEQKLLKVAKSTYFPKVLVSNFSSPNSLPCFLFRLYLSEISHWDECDSYLKNTWTLLSTLNIIIPTIALIIIQGIMFHKI